MKRSEPSDYGGIQDLGSPGLRHYIYTIPELGAKRIPGLAVVQTHRAPAGRGGEEKPAIWLWGQLPMGGTFKLFGLNK